MKQTKAKTPLSVGYTVPADGQIPFVDLVSRYRDAIGEVYFAFPGISSGRSPFGQESPYQDYDALNILTEDLYALTEMGVDRNLLFNSACGGADCMSQQHEREVLSILDFLCERGIGPTSITTTSPITAEIVKRNAPEIQVRASVNMRLDSVAALEYLGDGFDSFYIRRDLQRDLDTVKTFSAWCHANGKKLCMLANSGCLRNCPYQTFHDNMVAHDSDLREIRNDKDFLPHLCWKRYQDRENWRDFLRSSWIRPEDIHRYAPYVDVVKLATRQHIMPRMVIAAYTSGSFNGNLLNLTEPCFAGHFQPYVLDNKALDQVELPAACAANCTRCGKCDAILERALIKCAE